MHCQILVHKMFCHCRVMGRQSQGYIYTTWTPLSRTRLAVNALNLYHRGISSSTGHFQKQNKTGKELDVKRKGPYDGLSTGQKVKEAGKDVAYTGIIIAGVGVFGVMAYFIGRELFSSDSPSGVFSKSLKLCKKNEEITDLLGKPIKGYGETTRRGRRRHTSHTEYVTDGVKHMRMKFYIEGPYRKGTVQADVFQNTSGHYDYRYLFVEIDDYPRRTIVLEDNR